MKLAFVILATLLAVSIVFASTYAEPDKHLHLTNSSLNLTQSQTETITISISNLDIVYKYGYVYDGSRWKAFEFAGNKLSDNWLSKTGFYNMQVSLDSHIKGENYIVAYGCSLLPTQAYYCNGNKWILANFTLDAKE